MKKIALIVFLLIESIANAQNITQVIKLKPDSSLKNVRFWCSEVLDARANKENIGSSLGNANAVAQLDGDFTQHLKSAIDFMLPKQNEKLGLIVIVRNLAVSEKTESTGIFGFCKIEIEFAKRIDTVLYSLGVFDTQILGKGDEINSTHAKRILLGLEECFKKLDETNWENAKEFIIDDIHRKLVYDYKSVPPKGAYLNFEQMIRRIPIDTVTLHIRQYNASKKNPVYAVKSNKTDLPKNVQFVSDGEHVYLHFSKYEYAKSTLLGKYIYFRGKFQPLSNIEIDLATGAAFVAAGIVTGIFGGFVILPAGNSSAPINGLVLDTETGEIKGLTDYNITMLTKPFPDIFKAYRASNRSLEAKENVIKQLNTRF